MNEQVVEQVLKRLQVTMSLFSTVLEQLEELQWAVKDTLEDLELSLHPIPDPGAKVVEISKGGAAS